MTVRATLLLSMLVVGFVPTVRSQMAVSHQPSAVSTDGRRLTADGFFRRDVPHYGKWLTAGAMAAFTYLGAAEHRRSNREWDALLTICRSSNDACLTGPDGRYIRPDAEAAYQRSRSRDRRASRWLMGAQASLLATAALFIIDLHPGRGPENIPYSGLRVTLDPMPDGAALGLRIAF